MLGELLQDLPQPIAVAWTNKFKFVFCKTTTQRGSAEWIAMQRARIAIPKPASPRADQAPAGPFGQRRGGTGHYALPSQPSPWLHSGYAPRPLGPRARSVTSRAPTAPFRPPLMIPAAASSSSVLANSTRTSPSRARSPSLGWVQTCPRSLPPRPAPASSKREILLQDRRLSSRFKD